MEKSILAKCGYTLIEVLTVVAMIGILSTVGYGGLQGAIANSRVKDAAFNLAAYAESTANRARQLNDTLCVKKKTDKMLVTYRSSCANSDSGDPIDSLEMVVGVSLVDASVEGLPGENWAAGADFIPRFGLSAMPFEGYWAAKYGNEDLYGAAVKEKMKNAILPQKGSSDGFSDL